MQMPTVAAPMTDDEFEDYANRIQALTDLQQEPSFEIFIDLVRKQALIWQRSLNSGTLTFDDYLRITSKIKAVSVLMELIDTERANFAREAERHAAGE